MKDTDQLIMDLVKQLDEARYSEGIPFCCETKRWGDGHDKDCPYKRGTDYMQSKGWHFKKSDATNRWQCKWYFDD